MSDVKEVGRVFKDFLKIAYKKLDKLSIVNLIIIFCCFVYVVVSIVGDGLVTLVYSGGDIVAQILFHKSVHQNIDTTPVYVYMLFLIFSLIFCTFLVKKHISGKLW